MRTHDELLKLLEVVTIDYMKFGKVCVDAPCQIGKAKRFSGVSKYCYIFPDEDFVVKFPQVYREHNLNENECAQEVELYHSSHNYRVQRVLPETTFLGRNTHGVPFYKQAKLDYVCSQLPPPKYRKYCAMTTKINDDLIDRVRKSNTSDNRSIDTLWLKMVWLLYGEKFTRSLIKWINDNRINDLHNSNIGYIKNRPVIMDFCGYHR